MLGGVLEPGGETILAAFAFLSVDLVDLAAADSGSRFLPSIVAGLFPISVRCAPNNRIKRVYATGAGAVLDRTERMCQPPTTRLLADGFSRNVGEYDRGTTDSGAMLCSPRMASRKAGRTW